MTSRTAAVTANVLGSLPSADAASALDQVLGLGPDLVGLQEWGPRRRVLLRAHPHFAWVAPAYGGNVVGARTDRYRIVHSRTVRLGGWALVDRGARPVPVLPPRVATVAVLRDRRLDRVVTVISYHLVPGTQRAGHYRTDRPRLSARHRHEVDRLRSLVVHEVDHSAAVFALGDSNFHGLGLPPLTSAWLGRDDHPGTLGSYRKIDDVFGPGPAAEVRLLATASDHQAVLAVRLDLDPSS